MNFKAYQEKAVRTAIYPRVADYPIVGLMYAALGLNGEAGEVAEDIKKSWRNDMCITSERIAKIKEELGDVLWYVSAVAHELELDLDEIAKNNIKKLEARHKKDALKHE